MSTTFFEHRIKLILRIFLSIAEMLMFLVQIIPAFSDLFSSTGLDQFPVGSFSKDCLPIAYIPVMVSWNSLQNGLQKGKEAGWSG